MVPVLQIVSNCSVGFAGICYQMQCIQNWFIFHRDLCVTEISGSNIWEIGLSNSCLLHLNWICQKGKDKENSGIENHGSLPSIDINGWTGK